jgi:hypothetical protein
MADNKVNTKKVTKTVKTVKKTNSNPNSKFKKLSEDNYVKEDKSASDMLTADEIKDRLQNYERIYEEDMHNLKIDDKIRYFEVLEGGKFKYKPGGFLLVNKAPEYLVLVTSRGSWSVQLKNHIIFRAKSVEEVEATYKALLNDYAKNKIILQKRIKQFEEENNILKQKIKSLTQ